MLSLRLPVNNRLFTVKFLGSQQLYRNFQLGGVGVSEPNPGFVQGPAVFIISM